MEIKLKPFLLLLKINLWFKKQASSIIKFRWLIIAVFLLALAFQLEKFGNWVLDYQKTIIAVSITLAVILIYGMTKVEAAFDVKKTMGTKIPYVKNLVEISETELGSLYSYDLMFELYKNNSEVWFKAKYSF